MGRTFTAADEFATTPPPGILLSGAVWQRRYGSDPTIVGKVIDVNGNPTTVVGVMPVGFRLMMPPDAAVPDDLDDDQRHAPVVVVDERLARKAWPQASLSAGENLGFGLRSARTPSTSSDWSFGRA